MPLVDPSPVLPERYRLLEELGEGATCTVYKAEDAVLGHPVAIKVVRATLAIHARFRARFDREVALSAQVVHPRVIPVYDAGRLEDGQLAASLQHVSQHHHGQTDTAQQ